MADLGASINLMSFSIWQKLSLPELTPTQMTLELATRTVTVPKGIAEDVFVKVGKFHFPTDFVVVDFDADPRVPLILGRPFLKTACALIDVFEGEMTLRVGDEKLVTNIENTSKDLLDLEREAINQIDVIDVACDEYFEEVLNVQGSIDCTINVSSPSLTPFEGGDFILEEIEACLSCDSRVDHDSINPEEDILLLEKLLNDDPSFLPPKKLHNEEVKYVEKTDDFPEVELKDLPPHLEYAFLEGDDKLPIIIAKDLNEDDKAALIKVLKSH